jgi:hypothetical protein
MVSTRVWNALSSYALAITFAWLCAATVMAAEKPTKPS